MNELENIPTREATSIVVQFGGAWKNWINISEEKQQSYGSRIYQ